MTKRLLVLLTAVLVFWPMAAHAASVTVSENPADWTPHIQAGYDQFPSAYAAYKIKIYNGVAYVGGDFQQITDKHGKTFTRPYVFAFNAANGEVLPFDVPSLDGAVWGIGRGPDGSIYLGGQFSHPGHNVIKVDPITGNPDTAFDAKLDGSVRDVAVWSNKLILAGEFTNRLTARSLTTGAGTGYFRGLTIQGDLDGPGGWAPRVYRFAISHSKMVAIGNFVTVNGRNQQRAFMLNLGETRGQLADWHYNPLHYNCPHVDLEDNLRHVAFSPDGSAFVLVASGGSPQVNLKGLVICDGAARFQTARMHPTKPVWINYTNGDTMHSVVWTSGVIYVQGHFRHLDDGAVERSGIGAINPTTGLALPWNPGKDRGTGGKDLFFNAQGLWEVCDTMHIGGEVHERLALMPS